MIVPVSISLSLLSLARTLPSLEDPVRGSLQGTVDHFSYLVSCSTVVVALGVVLEGVEIVLATSAWIKRRAHKKSARIELQELADIYRGGEATCKKTQTS